MFHLIELLASAPIVMHLYGMCGRWHYPSPIPFQFSACFFMFFLRWSVGYSMFRFVELLTSAPLRCTCTGLCGMAPFGCPHPIPVFPQASVLSLIIEPTGCVAITEGLGLVRGLRLQFVFLGFASHCCC